MLSAQSLRYDPRVIVDYLSPEGPQVTGLRGVLVQGRLKQLRDAGFYETFIKRLPERHREAMLEALASSWVPLETCIAYYEALDGMLLSDAQLARMAEPVGASIFASMFVAFVAAARRAGADAGVWVGLGSADRVFSRMYNGGTCRVTQVGPKDAVVDIGGLPYAKLRCFRVSHCAFLRGVFSVASRACVVKPVSASDPRPDRLAVSISWV